MVSSSLSAGLVEKARARGGEIEYAVGDATDVAFLDQFESSGFDAVHCGMAIFYIADIRPLFACVDRVLKPMGRFVVSLMHPCFNNMSTTFSPEARGDGTRSPAIKVTGYLSQRADFGEGMAGLDPHAYFHRPFRDIFAIGFKRGFAVTGFEERAFQGEVGRRTDLLKWGPAYSEIPPVAVVRMERLKRAS